MTITAERSGEFRLGDRLVNRLGYGTMRLDRPGRRGAAAAGPHDRHLPPAPRRGPGRRPHRHRRLRRPAPVTDMIRKALHPYPLELTIVTSVGARWTSEGRWVVALSADELRRTVRTASSTSVSTCWTWSTCACPAFPSRSTGHRTSRWRPSLRCSRKGLIRHLGVSNVTTQTFADAKAIAPVVCVQNHYDVAHRHDDPLVDVLARAGIPFVACSPLGGFPADRRRRVSRGWPLSLETTETEVALTWLLARSPNILAIPSTREVAHLEQNLEAGARVLGPVELRGARPHRRHRGARAGPLSRLPSAPAGPPMGRAPGRGRRWRGRRPGRAGRGRRRTRRTADSACAAPRRPARAACPSAAGRRPRRRSPRARRTRAPGRCPRVRARRCRRCPARTPWTAGCRRRRPPAPRPGTRRASRSPRAPGAARPAPPARRPAGPRTPSPGTAPGAG